jgi:acyl-CoA thioester hydrolase
MAHSEPLPREAFGAFQGITTRWSDNDLYGHVNNVTYYSWFDTAVNRYLIEQGGLDIHNSPVIAYVVSSSCQYFHAVSYPDPVEVGLRVERLGNSSVTYGVGIFRADDGTALAQGQFVHVFVGRDNDRPVPVPESIRAALERLPGG